MQVSTEKHTVDIKWVYGTDGKESYMCKANKTVTINFIWKGNKTAFLLKFLYCEEGHLICKAVLQLGKYGI
jgi:hypothetical protein